MYSRKRDVLLIIFTVVIIVFAGCAQEPAWVKINKQVITEHKIQERVRKDIPETKVISNLEPGAVSSQESLPETEIAPGVKARLYWAKER